MIMSQVLELAKSYECLVEVTYEIIVKECDQIPKISRNDNWYIIRDGECYFLDAHVADFGSASIVADYGTDYTTRIFSQESDIRRSGNSVIEVSISFVMSSGQLLLCDKNGELRVLDPGDECFFEDTLKVSINGILKDKDDVKIRSIRYMFGNGDDLSFYLTDSCEEIEHSYCNSCWNNSPYLEADAKDYCCTATRSDFIKRKSIRCSAIY